MQTCCKTSLAGTNPDSGRNFAEPIQLTRFLLKICCVSQIGLSWCMFEAGLGIWSFDLWKRLMVIKSITSIFEKDRSWLNRPRRSLKMSTGSIQSFSRLNWSFNHKNDRFNRKTDDQIPISGLKSLNLLQAWCSSQGFQAGATWSWGIWLEAEPEPSLWPGSGSTLNICLIIYANYMELNLSFLK